MAADKDHETQPEKATLYNNEIYVDENLRQMQQIEGGGPPKKIIFSTLPLPLRIFGYFFITVMVLMAVTFLVVSVFR